MQIFINDIKELSHVPSLDGFPPIIVNGEDQKELLRNLCLKINKEKVWFNYKYINVYTKYHRVNKMKFYLFMISNYGYKKFYFYKKYKIPLNSKLYKLCFYINRRVHKKKLSKSLDTLRDLSFVPPNIISDKDYPEYKLLNKLWKLNNSGGPIYRDCYESFESIVKF